MEHTGFPSDETLAAFLDGKLDPDTRRRVIEHMTTCDECYATVVGGGLAPVTATPVLKTSGWKRHSLMAVAATALLVVGRVGWLAYNQAMEPNLRPKSGMEVNGALVAVTPPTRSFEGRLHGFPYRPYVVTRGQQALSADADYYGVYALASKLHGQLANQHSPKTLHDVAVAELILRNPNAAVDHLAEAIKIETGQNLIEPAIRSSSDLTLLIDLATALFARAQSTERPSDLPTALEAAERAHSIKATAETSWNRALCLEALALNAPAADAWREYLTFDTASPWAGEARRHLLNIIGDTYKRSNVPPVSRRLNDFGDVRLAQWAQAALTGNRTGAEALLRQAELAAEALVTADLLAHDTVEHLKRASAATAHTQLANAFSAYAAARQAYQSRRVDIAAKNFEAAAAALKAMHSPFYRMALINRASCLFYKNRYEQALATLSELQPLQDVRVGYRIAAADLYWLRGMCLKMLGRPDDARQNYIQAIDTFDASNDPEGRAAARSLLAEVESFLGVCDSAWSHRIAALQRDNAVLLSTRRYTIVNEAVEGSLAANCIAAAGYYQDEEVSIASRLTDQYLLADALLWRAVVAHADHDERAARSWLTQARVACAKVPEAPLQGKLGADIDWAEARLIAANDPARAIDLLSTGIAFAERSNDHVRMAHLEFERGRLHSKMGMRRLGLSDFSRALRDLERQRMTVRDRDVKASFFDGTHAAFCEYIDLLVSDGKDREAFREVERYRACLLERQLGTLEDTSVDIAEIAVSQRTPGTTLVSYAAGTRFVYAWIISRDGYHFVTLPFGASEVTLRVERFLKALRRSGTDRSAFDRVSSDLYDAIFAEIAPFVGVTRRVSIERDDLIGQIPFGALRGPAGYLVETFDFSTVYRADGASTHNDANESVGSANALVVYDQGEHEGGDFQVLPRASKEAAGVAAAYAFSTVERGADFSREKLTAALLRYSVVHFALHGISGGRLSYYGALVLQDREKNTPTLLTFEGLRASEKWQTEIFVLASCGSAVDGSGASMNSLAAELISAGVPAVVGALYDVDDAGAYEVMVNLHRGLASGVPVATALRHAQARAELEGWPPLSWAGFDVIGNGSAIATKRRAK